MKKAWIVACALAFASVAGFPQAPSNAPVNLAAVLGYSAPPANCAIPQSATSFAAATSQVQQEKATCTARCDPAASVSCTAATCQGVNRNCYTGERGHVTCNGVTKYCRDACSDNPSCDDCWATGNCGACCLCDGYTTMQCLQICGPGGTGGGWGF